MAVSIYTPNKAASIDTAVTASAQVMTRWHYRRTPPLGSTYTVFFAEYSAIIRTAAFSIVWSAQRLIMLYLVRGMARLRRARKKIYPVIGTAVHKTAACSIVSRLQSFFLQLKLVP